MDIITCIILGLLISENQTISAIRKSNKLNGSDERNVN